MFEQVAICPTSAMSKYLLLIFLPQSKYYQASNFIGPDPGLYVYSRTDILLFSFRLILEDLN